MTAAPEIRSFRIRQTIQTHYRDKPDGDSLTTLVTTARRDPPAIRTALSTDGGPDTISLIIDNQVWTRSTGSWTQTDIGNVDEDWTANAYRELGDMSLVAPLLADQVANAGRELGIEAIGAFVTTRVHAGSGLMLQLLMDAFEASLASQEAATLADPTPPDSYIEHYDADFWVDRETGFVIRERTVVEYTEERLHGRLGGTGSVTFTTEREFFDLNVPVPIASPKN